MKFKNLPVKFKTGESEGLSEGQFLVYPSTFTRTPDAYGDVVAKGAFAKGITKRKEDGIVLPGLFGHRLDDPDFYVASALEEGEDDHGWWIKGEFDLDSPKGAQVYRLVKSGRLRELSFAYDVLAGGLVKLDDGSDAYELRDLDVFEFSFVPVGANRDTSVVAVKSAIDALAGAKAGRVLAQKHIDSLRTAKEALEAVIAAAEGDDQEKAGGHVDVKDEGAARVKSEGVGLSPSRQALANHWLAQAL